MSDLIDRQAAIEVICDEIMSRFDVGITEGYEIVEDALSGLPSAEPEIAENLYLCKCYITDKDGLQHEVIHTGDIRRVTGWEI